MLEKKLEQDVVKEKKSSSFHTDSHDAPSIGDEEITKENDDGNANDGKYMKILKRKTLKVSTTLSSISEMLASLQ